MPRNADRTALLFAPTRDDQQNLSRALYDLHVPVEVADQDRELTTAQWSAVSLILVDLDHDPGWRERLKWLLAQAPGARLLAYSRLSEEHLWLDALDAGAFDFVCKPFQERELRWVLQSALHACSARLGGVPARC